MVDIKGLNKAEVLAALYNNARALGLGFLNFDENPMSVDEAEEILKQTTDFDHIKGRVMKVKLSSDDGFEEWLYDRDNGAGAAQRAIDKLRVKNNQLKEREDSKMDNSENRIVEIDGVKIEVDLRTAKRIDTFRVGDNVKVLCKRYDGQYEVKPGIITDFANFKEKPTIIVAVFNEGSWTSNPTIEFIHIYEGMEDKYEIVYTSDEDLRLTKDGVIEKFEREIQKKRNEAQDLENQLNYFKRHFLKE